MRKKIFKLTGALLLLAGGFTMTLAPKNAAAAGGYCRDLYNSCLTQCAPNDSVCAQDCQCVLRNCHGYQCP